MSKVSKELLRSCVKEQNFKSSNDVLTAMKEMFADVLQEALEAELENVNDLEYIEEQARIQLRMIKPGEILFVLDKEQDKDDSNGNDEKDN